MNSKDRVKHLFNSEEPDTIPIHDFLQDDNQQLDLDIEMVSSGQILNRKDTLKASNDKFRMLELEDPFQDLSNCIGLENVLMKIKEDNDFILQELLDRTMKMLAKAKVVIESEKVDGIWLWGDIAYNGGTFFSDAFYLENLYPMHKKICSFFDAYNLPVVLHSDGNIKGILPYLVDAGFNGIHPLESSAGMDLEELQEKYGRHLVFFGNLNVDLLRNKNTDDIIKIVKSKLDSLDANSRYVFGFDSPITNDIDIDKYMDVLDFVRTYKNLERLI